MQISGCGALLSLLDDLRLNIEGLPLLPTEEQHREWRSRFEDDDRGDGDDHDSADGGQDTGNDNGTRRVQQRG